MRARAELGKGLAGMKFLGRAIVMIIDQGPGEQVDDRRIALMAAQTDMPATLCAITPQPPKASRPLLEKRKISFDLLTDHGNEYAAKLGPRFKLPGDLKEVCLSFGNNLAVRNGKDRWTLPMPGRFVIDRWASCELSTSIPITAIGPSLKRRSMMYGR